MEEIYYDAANETLMWNTSLTVKATPSSKLQASACCLDEEPVALPQQKLLQNTLKWFGAQSASAMWQGGGKKGENYDPKLPAGLL